MAAFNSFESAALCTDGTPRIVAHCHDETLSVVTIRTNFGNVLRTEKFNGRGSSNRARQYAVARADDLNNGFLR